MILVTMQEQDTHMHILSFSHPYDVSFPKFLKAFLTLIMNDLRTKTQQVNPKEYTVTMAYSVTHKLREQWLFNSFPQ